ncbi:unnamed protein product [Schistosoma margrebowiei]|uniref:SCP domain-containing protein n=1 Tax=Schistosoma margrebowiei TaxID=48269 RepID=A0AA84ZFA4_9TREM|nr:unnamed protein product [Schistosoma margrebowiei]
MPNDLDIEFNEECIIEHNRLRALHGCPELILDYELAKDAQKYAEHLASVNELEHCTDTDSGENLAFFTTTTVAQKKDFTGHFTQVVWKSTTTAGFGRAWSKDRHSIYVVGRYDPPGNFSDEFLENVPPLISE